MERNWADLPPELYIVILKKLPEICDFVRCRAVCKSWRTSSSVSDLPPQFPWILKRSEGPYLEFYSIIFNKVYAIRARCSSGKRLFGPAGGYLLTGQEGNADSFSLLNPLNNRDVPLPVLHDCDPYLFPLNICWFNPPSFQIHDYMLLFEYGISVRCKPGDDRWDIIGPGHECQYRCCYFKGFLFRVECETGVTKIMDISKELYVIPPPKYEILSNMSLRGPYFVESCGEILAICYNESKKRMAYKFYIHRLKFGNGKENPYWVKLSSIGDRIILFFDFTLVTGCGYKGNCIYFINKGSAFHLCDVHVIYMYDIENGETVLIYTPFIRGFPITWFMPTLNHI
ncbi:F-box protein [Carex littledalei]|uniref:F-box protein n=1 Tax=Carex littledalei TaxID=544730 RepID=A0A833RSQ0_9POAL|nr:F-box protein [Carex littledalei]